MADVDLDVVDEFTDTPFECNPLAVVQGAEDPAGGVHERRRLRVRVSSRRIRVPG